MNVNYHRAKMADNVQTLTEITIVLVPWGMRVKTAVTLTVTL